MGKDPRPRIKTRVPGIYKRGNRYSFSYRDNRGRMRWGSAATMGEAKTKRAALTADVQRGDYRELSKVAFADYAREWIESYTGRTDRGLREQTRTEYRRVLGLDADGNQRADNGAAVAYFGQMQLAAITPLDVKGYLAKVAERKVGKRSVSRGTVRQALAPLRALFATAVEDGLIRSNPAAGIRLPKAERDEPERKAKALTEEELTALLDASPERWRLLFAFLAESGLRIGEAVALTWADIDFGRQVAKVRRRFYKGHVGPPKSRYGRRDARFSPETGRALWNARKLAGSDEEPVFANERGEPVDASTAYRAVKAAAKKVGVESGLHTLRHTAATRLFAQGWNVKQVQTQLGHHKPSFTLDVYVHLLSNDLPQVLAVGREVTGPSETHVDAEAAEAAEIAAPQAKALGAALPV